MLVALGACGGEPTAPTDLWTLDTSSWPDCGWASSTMIYTDLVDVRMHDLATGEDKVVWAEAALRGLSGLVPPAPTFLSLSADRRWMAVTLLPLNQTRVQLLALSCDGVTAQRLGPDDAIYIGGAKISPDGKRMALGHRSPHAPDGLLVLDLVSGNLRAVSLAGRAFQWSPDGKRLLHEYPSGSVFDDPFYLGVTTIVGDAPDVRTKREVLLDTSCVWDGLADSAICSNVETEKWPFDDSLPTERIAPGAKSMMRAADGALYGLSRGSQYLVKLDMATQTWNRVGPATSIRRFAL